MQYTYTAVITEKDGTFYAKVPDVDGYEIFHLEQFLGCLYNSTPDIHSKAFLII